MENKNVPAHVGIIMDGNGRWAKKRGLPRVAGHSMGAKAFSDIAKHVSKTPVQYLTVYAFSTENWNRPQEEVDGIMNLLREFLRDADKYRGENIRLRVLGDLGKLSPDIRERINYLESNSRDRDGLTLSIALNYGGREEILHAVKSVAELYAGGGIDFGKLDETEFSRYLYTSGLPDVDLVIRTSGELRISNFLLWQSAYAEYVFTDVLWPDFKSGHFDAALLEYSKRTRRFGKAGV